jgi:hypothetical protein
MSCRTVRRDGRWNYQLLRLSSRLLQFTYVHLPRVVNGLMINIVHTDVGATSCTPAAKGYYVPSAAATAQSSCTPGSYSGMTGQISCSDCTAGHYCPNSAMATPSTCAAGSFSPGGQVTACSSCGAGTFASFEGSTACCQCCASFYSVGRPACSSSFFPDIDVS